MVGDATAGVLGQVFREGTVAGLSDAELLERCAARRDPASLEALVSRHGPMVLGVCRRTLRDEHDVADAFQATFLVLTRRAGSPTVCSAGSLGPWLHGVAWRVCTRLRADTARRRARVAAGVDVAEVADRRGGPDTSDLRDRLDQELSRLPEKYRVPVVLCHLEGLTQEEAGRRLGCPTATVGVRLMRARERLRDR